MRRLIVANLILLALSLPELGLAQQPPSTKHCGNTPSGEIIYCTVERDGYDVTEVSTQSSTASPGSSGPTIRYVPYSRLTTDANGQGCVTTGYVREGSSPTDAAPDNPDQPEGAGGWNNIYAEYPPCPEQPRTPGQPAPILTRALVAARYWEQIPLPKPQPLIAPGRAITGKPAYLETRGQTTSTYTSDTGFGPLRIDAVGVYLVTWGDGETSGPHSYEGKPWPDGHITHEYLTVGRYNIVVVEKWTATWSLDGESGVLRALQTTGRIDGFPVQQIQAVIGR